MYTCDKCQHEIITGSFYCPNCKAVYSSSFWNSYYHDNDIMLCCDMPLKQCQCDHSDKLWWEDSESIPPDVDLYVNDDNVICNSCTDQFSFNCQPLRTVIRSILTNGEHLGLIDGCSEASIVDEHDSLLDDLNNYYWEDTSIERNQKEQMEEERYNKDNRYAF